MSHECKSVLYQIIQAQAKKDLLKKVKRAAQNYCLENGSNTTNSSTNSLKGEITQEAMSTRR